MLAKTRSARLWETVALFMHGPQEAALEREKFSCPTQKITQAPAGISCITPPLVPVLLPQVLPFGRWSTK